MSIASEIIRINTIKKKLKDFLESANYEVASDKMSDLSAGITPYMSDTLPAKRVDLATLATHLPSITVNKTNIKQTSGLFKGLTNLVTAPSVTFTSDAYSYDVSSFFEDCSSLTGGGPVDISARTVTSSSYSLNSLFKNCSLLKHPILIKYPKLTNASVKSNIAECCYNCPELEEPIELPNVVAYENAKGAYQNCRKLKRTNINHALITGSAELIYSGCYCLEPLDVVDFSNATSAHNAFRYVGYNNSVGGLVINELILGPKCTSSAMFTNTLRRINKITFPGACQQYNAYQNEMYYGDGVDLYIGEIDMSKVTKLPYKPQIRIHNDNRDAANACDTYIGPIYCDSLDGSNNNYPIYNAIHNYYPVKKVIIKGFINLGKGFPNTKAANSYNLNYQYFFSRITDYGDSVIDLLTGLYDLTAAGKNPQTVTLSNSVVSKLDPAFIATITAKGWSIASA